MHADVIIVGGGIGGAVLAGLLARSGRRTVVLERNSAAPKWTRPEILWPRTVETLRSLLPREEWERDAMLPVHGFEVATDRGPVLIPLELAVARSGVQPWSTDPHLTRELLLGLQGIEVRRGVEVVDVIHRNGRIGGVRARRGANGEEFEMEADWTVGDDGEKSVVRRAAGIALETRPFPLEFFCLRIDWPDSPAPAAVRLFPNLRGIPGGIVAVGCVPLPQGKGTGMIVVRGREFDACPRAAEAWARWCEMHPALDRIFAGRKFPEDFPRMRRAWGHAGRYGVPGVVLMGDAAHPPSPAGGQGANMSAADAVVLAELLTAGASSLVEKYERRRRPANARSLRITHMAAFVLGLPAWCRGILPLDRAPQILRRHPLFAARPLRHFASAFQEVV